MDSPDLQARYERIDARARDFGDGGREVLETAYHALAAGEAVGRWPDVGLEDLWAHAIQEGRSLFARPPDRRWGATGPAETRDMIGQTTVGPWQITVDNARGPLGEAYGLRADLPPAEVAAALRERPSTQAALACDLVQRAYVTLGRRGPYAIQSYFWLSAFVKGEIGQGPWDAPVLPGAPPAGGDRHDPTAEQKRQTGFYAKQVVLGSPHNPYGLIWWLWVTRDDDAIVALLRRWREEPERSWNDARSSADPTDRRGRFAITADDLKYLPDDLCRRHVAGLIAAGG